MTIDLSEKAALLVVDVQNGFHYSPFSSLTPSNPTAVGSISTLLTLFRARHLPIIHVHQNSLSPASPFNPLTNPQGFLVQPAVSPLPTEKVVEKHENSAFIGTALDVYLKTELKVKTLVIAGLTLEHCIDSTCRHAANLGYKVYLPRESTSAYEVRRAPGSKDGREARIIDAETVQEVIFGALQGEFVEIVTMAEVREALEGFGEAT